VSVSPSPLSLSSSLPPFRSPSLLFRSLSYTSHVFALYLIHKASTPQRESLNSKPRTPNSETYTINPYETYTVNPYTLHTEPCTLHSAPKALIPKP